VNEDYLRLHARMVQEVTAAPIQKSGPLWPPNVVSHGCVVQRLCSSLLH